ncbi:MAG: anti-sigma factor, partial [Actinomycetota bacterium]
VAVPVGLAIGGSGDPDRRADLLALSEFGGTGEAELDGRDLNVRFDGEAAPEGSFYELWLLDFDDAEELVGLESLGQIEVSADGSYQIPDGIDLDEFDVVDVSVELDDGNPEHSGVSILRGDLTEA